MLTGLRMTLKLVLVVAILFSAYAIGGKPSKDQPEGIKFINDPICLIHYSAEEVCFQMKGNLY